MYSIQTPQECVLYFLFWDSVWTKLKIDFIELKKKYINPYSAMSDQDITFPYNINIISSRQVMKIKENIN